MSFSSTAKLSLGFLILIFSASLRADQPGTQARIFIGQQFISPDQVNNVIHPAGLNSFSTTGMYGLEVTQRIAPILNVGIRGEGSYAKVYETASPSADPQNPYYSSIQQAQAEFVVRVDIANSKYFKMDTFGGIGASSVSMDIRTASGEGNFQHQLTSPVENAGVSLGVGGGNIYLMVEGGMKWNNIGSLAQTGVTSNAINQVDLSGAYVTLGLIFNGIPSFIKVGK